MAGLSSNARSRSRSEYRLRLLRLRTGRRLGRRQMAQIRRSMLPGGSLGPSRWCCIELRGKTRLRRLPGNPVEDSGEVRWWADSQIAGTSPSVSRVSRKDRLLFMRDKLTGGFVHFVLHCDDHRLSVSRDGKNGRSRPLSRHAYWFPLPRFRRCTSPRR